jgi:hypothetical protein
MATVIQFPDSLSLAGNISDIILNSTAQVNFKIMEGSATLLEENYDPDSESLIKIRLRDILPLLLYSVIPSSNVFEQVNAVKTLALHIDNSPTTIKVVNGGVNASIDAETFLAANWLTWQPQQKKVKFTDPEWLSYFSTEAVTIKLKAYFKEDPPETITLTILTAHKLYSLNVNFQYLSGLFSTAQPVYFDIWTEYMGIRLSFIQRYVLIADYNEFDDIFVFENTLGAIDTVRLTGSREEDNQFEISSAIFDENSSDYNVQYGQVFTKNTGYYTSARERSWLNEFMNSTKRYYLTPDGLKSITISKTDAKFNLSDSASFYYTFNFALSRQTKFLNFARTETLPANVEIIDPDTELFFLAPRLIEFPAAVVDDLLLFPVQMPFVQEWRQLSFSALRSSILGNINLLGLATVESVNALSVSLSTHTHTFDQITNKPNTLIGYGITDGIDLSAVIQYLESPNTLTNFWVGDNLSYDGAYLNATGEMRATGDVVAYASGSPTGSFWDSMPVATLTTVGGIILGGGTTNFLRADGNWASVTSGTFDHSVMSNLSFALSGHTGFQASLGFTPENISNKITSFTTPTDAQYPSALLVSNQLAGKISTYGSQTAKYVLAAPNAAAGSPSFRALVASDIPALSYEASGNISTHSALRTGVHGINITTGKTLSVSNTITLSASNDTSTLNISTGGTLGTNAFNSTAFSIIGTTPADTRIAIWSSATTIKGDAGLTYDGSYLKATGEMRATGDVVAYATGSPTGSFWDAMPAATVSTIGGIIVGSDFTIAGGVLSIAGGVAFDLAANYSPTGAWTFTQTPKVGAVSVSLVGHTHAYVASSHLTDYTHANIANGQTAYGWGNHDSVGYLTSQISHDDVLVDGDASVTTAANKLVVRDGNGDLFGRYINLTNTVETGTVTSLYGKLSGQGDYLRSLNASNVQTFLGLGSAAYATISDYVTLATEQTISGLKTFSQYIIFSNGRKGLVGVFNPSQTQAIFSMGHSYTLVDGGASNVYGDASGFYGLAWSYDPNYGGAGNNPQSKAGLFHQLLVMNNNETLTAIGHGIWTKGNVGIGTTNAPTAKLEVKSDDVIFTKFNSNYFNREIITGVDDTTFEPIIQAKVLSSGAERQLSINPYGGNVGIGTTSPGFILDIEGSSTDCIKFGIDKPIYLINNSPYVGFNMYYKAGWKYGKGSSASFGGAIGLAPTTGTMSFYTTLVAGNDEATAGISQKMSLSKEGTLTVTGDVIAYG